MKSKMKKFTSIAAMSAILASTSLSSVFANGAGLVTGQTQSTQIHVGILEGANKPDQINVTVPTVLAITVHADTTVENGAPTTYVGGSSGNGANANGVNSLTFENKSTRSTKEGLKGIPLSITGVKIKADSNTPWSILKEDVKQGEAATDDKDAFKLNLTLNGNKFQDLKHGEKKEMYFKGASDKNEPFNIPAPEIIAGEASPKTANMEVIAKAGGKNSQYNGKGTGKEENGTVTAPAAFTIEWVITSNSNSQGEAEKK